MFTALKREPSLWSSSVEYNKEANISMTGEDNSSLSGIPWESFPHKCGTSLADVRVLGMNDWAECCTCYFSGRNPGKYYQLHGNGYPQCTRQLQEGDKLVNINRPCCPAWAVQCKPGEGWYDYQLTHDEMSAGNIIISGCGGYEQVCKNDWEDEGGCREFRIAEKSSRKELARFKEALGEMPRTGFEETYGEMRNEAQQEQAFAEAKQAAYAKTLQGRAAGFIGFKGKKPEGCGCGDYQRDYNGRPQCLDFGGKKPDKELPCCLGLTKGNVNDKGQRLIECKATDPWIQHLTKNLQKDLNERRRAAMLDVQKAEVEHQGAVEKLNQCMPRCLEYKQKECIQSLKDMGPDYEKHEREMWQRSAAIAKGEGVRDRGDNGFVKFGKAFVNLATFPIKLAVAPIKMVANGIGDFVAELNHSKSSSGETRLQCCACQQLKLGFMILRGFGLTDQDSTTKYCTAPDCTIYQSTYAEYNHGKACTIIAPEDCPVRPNSRCPSNRDAFFGNK